MKRIMRYVIGNSLFLRPLAGIGSAKLAEN
jgi:hypothetical protein